jgi:hypothetical protein
MANPWYSPKTGRWYKNVQGPNGNVRPVTLPKSYGSSNNNYIADQFSGLAVEVLKYLACIAWVAVRSRMARSKLNSVSENENIT